nr:MAG TPA: hypothetical protein [Caudoviricetes sp.]
MSLDLIKKKIQLYVSENGETKVAKYYRIPTPSDSMEYSRENNAYKGCVRWYARVSGDRISFAYFSRIYPGVEQRFGVRDVLKRYIKPESIKVLEPIIPDSLLNDRESSFSMSLYDISNNRLIASGNPAIIYSSSTGYHDAEYFHFINSSDNHQNITVAKDVIFSPSGVVTSDKYADLSSEVPTNWVEMGTIDSIKREVEAFLNGEDTIDRGPMYDFEKLLLENNYRRNRRYSIYPSYIIYSDPHNYTTGTPQSFDLSQNSDNLLFIMNKGGKLVNNTLNININASQLGNGAVYIVYKLLNEDAVKSNTYTKEYFSSHSNISISDFDRYDIVAAFVNDTNTTPISFEGELDTSSVLDYRRLNDRLTKFATNRETVTVDNSFVSYGDFFEKEFLNYKSSENSIEVVIDNIRGIKDIFIDLDVNNRVMYIDAITKDGHFKSIADSITGPITLNELADVHSLVISGFKVGDDDQLLQSVYINKIKVTRTLTAKEIFDLVRDGNENRLYYESDNKYVPGPTYTWYHSLDLSNVPTANRNLNLDNISNTNMGLRVIHKDENSENYIDTHMTVLEFKKYVLDHITVNQFVLIADDKNFDFFFSFS